MDSSHRRPLLTQSEEQVKAEFQGISSVPFSDIGIRRHGRLPHWEKECGLYFVTFRTYDSLPKDVFKNAPPSLFHGRRGLRQREIEQLLDRGTGSPLFADPRCASLVAESLRGASAKYRLIAWCVMPNHIHFIARLLPGVTLADVMHSLKSFTAKRINKLLSRTGPVWQREYYDRLIRDADEFRRAVTYVVKNPEKAGLKNWIWVEDLSGMEQNERERDAPATVGETPTPLDSFRRNE
ncbi:MAG: REP-associated tyrosine transposase [Acidobacteriaceae bacterium]